MSTLEFSDLKVVYGHGRQAVAAVNEVSFIVTAGEIVGVVGESGSGKSTVARAAVGLVEATSGRILYDGVDVVRARGAARRRRRGIQMVFQDPNACLDPRMTVGASIDEAIDAAIARGVLSRRTSEQRRERIRELLELVHLDPALAGAYPSSLSGGQRQRVALIRAVAAEPGFLIADEITSALDVSVQGSVLNALVDLQRRLGFSVLFISHNVPIVRRMCPQVVVMHGGSIVEAGPSSEVLTNPAQPYTRELLDAVPRVGQPIFATASAGG
ncbi:ABC transporter ATP-binding protein [Agromyces aerolatus]|uniref:ABC transporter ATP-binding protein n=1 Tax=Agromyces sp. LY-1074 TaxID=3074080 RepID=UPI00285FA8C0|nr:MULTISPECIES: ATP-binding cassette domain-containing protein [unclassified Agromyces]MDR5700452.1 ATP-binding cassette domain-containing protein [Agromyces sp. LY-1074]MDR5706973.1 ATP-binding cassette domain-containing protein [Agromyces sp. LY-1358]